MGISRRKIVLGASLAGVTALGVRLGASARKPASLPEYLSGDALLKDVVAYEGLGVHRTGSLADQATASWMEAHLNELGFGVERIEFSLSQFEPSDCRISIANTTVPMAPQWPVAAPIDITAPLIRLSDDKPLVGAIAIATFPYKKRSSIAIPAYWDILAQAKARGAMALVAITEGPTGEIIALNAPKDVGALPLPVGLVAPRLAAPLLTAATSRTAIRFVISGTGPRNIVANNVLGLLDRPSETIVVSTPISGWTHAGGERGPGVALWRALARWAAQQGQSRFVFLATSGHELGHLGFHAALPRLRQLVPNGTCKLWVHLGANLAVHALDSNAPASGRYLAGTPTTLPGLTARFAGVNGLWPPLPASKSLVAGELTSILSAGYAPAIGIFGAGPWHHTIADNASVTSSTLLDAVAKPTAQTLMAWDSA